MMNLNEMYKSIEQGDMEGAEMIDAMFANTDKNGILPVHGNLFLDNNQCFRLYLCKVNWDKETYEKLKDEYINLVKMIKSISEKIIENEELSEEETDFYENNLLNDEMDCLDRLDELSEEPLNKKLYESLFQLYQIRLLRLYYLKAPRIIARADEFYLAKVFILSRILVDIKDCGEIDMETLPAEDGQLEKV